MDSNKLINQKRGADVLLWIFGTVLVVVAIGANHYFSDQPFLYRLVGVVFLFALSLFALSKTQKGTEFLALLKDARAEVRRVVWPTKQETWSTAGIVIVVVFISALVLWGVDYALGSLVSYFIG